MSSQDPAVNEALAACIRSGGSPAAVDALREHIEWLLIDRLTVVSRDRAIVMGAVDRTFELFAQAVGSGAALNWLHWIVATALALAAQETGQVAWVDWVATDGPAGTPHERRMLTFRVILTLDGGCQWVLLRCVARPRKALMDRSCHRELGHRLRTLAGAR